MNYALLHCVLEYTDIYKFSSLYIQNMHKQPVSIMLKTVTGLNELVFKRYLIIDSFSH